MLLSVIPWPGPSVFKISCPRDRASVVRRIVHKVRNDASNDAFRSREGTMYRASSRFQRWMPILKKYQVELPLECPFHESRDIFRPQQRAKHQHRPSQWTCGLCGKSFYAEKHLDAHFDNRHKSNVNTVSRRSFASIILIYFFRLDTNASICEPSRPRGLCISLLRSSRFIRKAKVRVTSPGSVLREEKYQVSIFVHGNLYTYRRDAITVALNAF